MLLIAIFLVVIEIAAASIILSVYTSRRGVPLTARETGGRLKTGAILFLGVLALELGAGFYFSLVRKDIMGDAAARVANAFYVLHITPPHLASIGFVWTPLPSFLEMIVLAFWPLYEPLASSALAGVIVTAFFAAGAALLVLKNGKRFGLSAWVTWLIVILYCFNPFIFVYGFNGMSESIFIFSIILAVTQLTQWMDDAAPFHLLWIAVALVIGFLTRYEAIPFAVAMLVAVAFVALANKRKHAIGNSRYSFFEGTSLVVFLPLALAVGLWILANYLIMGDPFFFLRSNYSNSALTQYVQSPMFGHLGATISYIAKESAVFTVVLAPILIIRLFTKRFFKWETLVLLVFILAIPVMQAYLLWDGKSYGWLRFFVYPLPILVAWMPFEIRELKDQTRVWSTAAGVFGCIALLASAVLTGVVMTNPAYASDEYNTYIAQNTGQQAQRDVADYINQNIAGSTMLLDPARTGYIILNLDKTGGVITDVNPKFTQDLTDPAANGVGYILVVEPRSGEIPDLVNTAYPALYTDGAPWCSLVQTFDGYKLYKVN